MKEGYKKTDIGVIPDDWQVKSLGEIFIFSGGLSASREMLSEEGINYLHYGDIHKRKETVIDLSIDKEWLPKLNEPFEKLKDGAKLYNGDVVFADASEDYEGIGKSIVVINEEDDNFVAGLHTIVGKGGNNLLNTYYKRYCFSTSDVRKQFRRLATGTSVYGISRENIKKINIAVPPLKEQEKIAEILSSVDCQIDDTEMLIEKCRVLKKGLMQRLLSNGIGHNEFKMSEVGEIPVGWEVKKLQEVCELIDGDRSNNYPSPNELVDKGILFLSTSNIKNNKLDYSECKYITQEKFDSLRKGKLEVDDIIITLRGTIGSTALFKGDIYNAGFINAQMLIIRAKRIDARYLSKYLTSLYFKKQIDIVSSGSAQPQLTKKDLSTIKIAIPNIEEQIKIELILSTLDNEIEEYENKKQSLEELKKGLMQQLLTGKIRTV